MVLPCEIAANKIVPSIKAKLAKKLKKSGMKQKEIARLLGVTTAAVSQYLSGKRAIRSFNKAKIERHKDICKLCGCCK